MSLKETLIKVPKEKPTLSLSSKDLPEIKNWKVGGKYRITIDVEQTASRKADEYDDDKGLHATFKVLKASEHEADE